MLRRKRVCFLLPEFGKNSFPRLYFHSFMWYNGRTTEGLEVRRVEGGVNSAEKDRLGYLFEICSDITGSHIAFWLTQEDFRSEMIRYMDCHTPITKELILHVMEEVYNENMKDVTAGIHIDFNFQRARRAIRQIKASISWS